MENKVKTVKDRQAQIQRDMIKLLNLPSAYSVWDPIKMDWKLSRTTRLLGVSEIEQNFTAGKYAKSDMHILKAVHALGFATKAHINAVLKYWKKVDELEAQRIGREMLNIPVLTEKELWERIVDLCRHGVLVRHEFWPPEVIRKENDTARSIFRLSASGTSMYKTILTDSTMSYDQRMAYFNEEDVFRYVLSGMAATSFLASPYTASARFGVTVNTGRRRHSVMSILKMCQSGQQWDDQKKDSRCRLIFEGITFRTNPTVVTYETRYKAMVNRVKELWEVVSYYREEAPAYVVFCLEDGFGIKDLLKIIGTAAPELYHCSLYTTGTVLEYNRVQHHPENIQDCYLEYLPADQGKLTGAVGYYFLG